LKVLIDGTIPRSAGLSSSSALVVCSALTTAINNGININKVYISILFLQISFDISRVI
jgi:galactokinase